MKKIFISYAPQDKLLKDLLVLHLEKNGLQSYCRIWPERQLPGGDNWDNELRQTLNNSDATVLLITQAYLDSYVILHNELPYILRLNQEQKITVFPALFEDSDWHKLPVLNTFQVFPSDEVPLMNRGLETAKQLLSNLAQIIAHSQRTYPSYDFISTRKSPHDTKNKPVTLMDEKTLHAENIKPYLQSLPEPRQPALNALQPPVPKTLPDPENDSKNSAIDNLFQQYKFSAHKEETVAAQLEKLENLENDIYVDDSLLAAEYNNIAVSFRALGNVDKAREFQLKDLKISEKKLDPRHPDLAVSYNNLALSYRVSKNYEKAMEYQLKDLRISEEKLDKHHPDLATSYDNISTICLGLEQYKKALLFQKKAIRIREKIMDKNHPALATSYNNLASIYRAMGYLEQALDYQLRAVKISETTLENDHPQLATVFNNLALIYLAMQQNKRAQVCGKRAIKILEKNFPPDHPNLTRAKKNLEVIRLDL
jgi:tetratricopeptide (TPR) repeat protein